MCGSGVGSRISSSVVSIHDAHHTTEDENDSTSSSDDDHMSVAGMYINGERATIDMVRVVDLCKVYEPQGKVAVKSISFGVMPGEVFGFLGTNGAGKSTALSILTQ